MSLPFGLDRDWNLNMRQLLLDFGGRIGDAKKALTMGSGSRKWTLLLVAVAALLPVIGSAQAVDFPSVVVFDFKSDGKKVKSSDIGKIVSEAIRNEYQKTGKADVIPGESTKRVLEDLGYETVPSDASTMIRIAQELRASAYIVGEIVEARIAQVGGGNQAQILIKMQMIDVASGMPINGAQVVGSSGVRTGDVSEETMYSDASRALAFDAIREMSSRQLPSATVLNTLPDQALINKGTRSGVKPGMELIIVRGKDQVGTATVVKVDADSAFISFNRLMKGVQPGDKVRALYTPDRTVIGISKDAQPRTTRRAQKGSNSGIVSLLFVMLALAFLLGNGRASNTNLASVRAEATSTLTDQAGVLVSWTRDPFVRGNQEGPYQWQVWRHDGSTTPCAITEGMNGYVVDDSFGTNATAWLDYEDQTSTVTCDGDIRDTADNAALLLVPGTPYQYSVTLIYRVDARSLPVVPDTIPEDGWCYFKSSRVIAKGIATPLVRPELRTPDPDQIVTTPLSFQFTSVRGAIASVALQYVVQLSTDPLFSKNSTVTLPAFQEFTEAGGQTVSSPTFDTSSYFVGSNDVFWRVGARNIADTPGPVKDASGQRYVFSAPRRFKRIADPQSPTVTSGGGVQ